MKKTALEKILCVEPDFWEKFAQLIVDEKVVKIQNFGVFEHRSYGPRKVYHPGTGECHIGIPRSRVVFKASKNIFSRVDMRGGSDACPSSSPENIHGV